MAETTCNNFQSLHIQAASANSPPPSDHDGTDRTLGRHFEVVNSEIWLLLIVIKKPHPTPSMNRTVAYISQETEK